MGFDLGIRVPTWGGWEHWLLHAEDRIEEALSSNNWVLNTFLSPVRNFVGYTLHPLFAFGDFLWGFGINVGEWVFNHIPDLAWDVLYAFAGFYNLVTDYTNWTVGILRGEASRLFTDAKDFATHEVQAGVSGLRDLIDGARSFASDLFWKGAAYTNTIVGDAIGYAERLAAGARELADTLFWKGVEYANAGLHDLGDAFTATAAKLYDFAVAVEHRAADLAKTLAEGALHLAQGAIDVLKRDVFDKIGGPFASFLSTEWHWAMGLLKLLESAAEWLGWATFHLVPEVTDTYRQLKALIDTDFDELVKWGVSWGAA